MATFTGDNGDNTLVGLAEDDIINGLGGADSLSGLGGTDVINGGAGNDTLQGGEGNDVVDGGTEDDTIIHVFADNVGTQNEYDGGADTDTLRLELTSSELADLVADIRALDDQLNVNPGSQYTFNAVNLVVDNFENLEIVLDGTVVAVSDLPPVIADTVEVTASEGSGDTDVNVLSNDDATPVVEVNGDAANVGVAVAGSNGGLFTVSADGSTDFDANSEFVGLGAGETAVTEVSYGAEVSGVQGTYDIILTQDLSASFVDDLPNVRTAFDSLFDDLTAGGDDVGFGVASFIDKPFFPFGNPAAPGDYAYQTDQAVSTDKATTQATLDALATGDGGRQPESQLVALQQIALRATTEIGFRDGAQRFIVLQTDAPFAQEGDFAAAGPDDGDLDTTELEDYPSVANVGALLQAANISVIFAVSPQQTTLTSYNDLLTNLGVNGAVVQLDADSSNLSSAIQSALNTLTSTATATVSAVVAGENDPITAVADTATVGEDDAAPTTIDLTSNDVDPDVNDDPEILSIDTTGTQGTVTVNLDNDTVDYDPNGAFEGLGAGETAVDTFTYTVTDGNGTTSTETVSVTVTGENDDPVATGETFTTGESGLLIGDILGNDTDVDGDALQIISANGNPANVPFTATSAGGRDAAVTVSSTGVLNFVVDTAGNFEDLGAGETDTITVTYTVSDGNGGTDTETVSVTVNGENDGPTANPDTATVGEDDTVPTVIDLTGNDVDPDGTDDPEIASIDTTGTQGTVTINLDNDSVTYDPAGAFEGLGAGETTVDTFTYTVTDGNGGTATETVSVTVTGENDDPVAADDTGSATVGGTTTVDVLANDVDPDINDTLTILGVGPAARGTASIVGGQVQFETGNDFDFLVAGVTATETISYTISDGNGVTSTASLSVTVSTDRQAPTVVDDTATVPQGQNVDINVLNNDNDPDGDTLTVIDVSDPANGATTINGDGTINFAPAQSFFGEETFTYTVSDGTGLTGTASVTVTVVDNQAPFLPEPISFSVNEGETLAADLDAFDLESNTISYDIGGGDDGALFSIDANTGELSFRTAPDFDNPADANGDNLYQVDITTSDIFGSLTQTVEVEVLEVVPPNFAPEITTPLPTVEFQPVFQFISNGTQGVITDVDATDANIIPDGDTIQFRLFGEDAPLFNIDADSGEISLDQPLTDVRGSFDGDAIYEIVVLVEDSFGETDTIEIDYLLFVGE